ncbi:MAG TPA: Mur ligase family protein [Chitinophagaceae bacterium]|nr:Mur ligase family protein [Chitinophagaceae bacterium]
MKKIHFIAMGGSVMHQLAIALSEKGYRVTGSDDEIYEPARSNLEKAGLLPIHQGWDPEQITPDLDAVILGMHAREDNPEIIRARSLQIPLFSFPEYVFRESVDKTRVVIGGSHGKTTITSMILHVLRTRGKDFDYLVGAQLPGFAHSVRISDAPLIVCEGDEYPASALQKIPKFLFYHPRIAVLSGIAWDHINVFPTLDNYLEQFARFIREMEPAGILIYNENDPALVSLVQQHGKHLQLIAYGMPEYHIKDGRTTVRFNQHTVSLQVFGAHNLQNLCAAKLVCQMLGMGEEEFLGAIGSFTGASRRLEKVFDIQGAAIFRDFAHAPSKVRASIGALREQFPDRTLIAVLELHTYSSLNAAFLSEYRHAMDQADTAAVFYSNHALEIKRLPPLSPALIRKGFDRKDLQVLENVEDLASFLAQQPTGNANLLMMSSGSFEATSIAKMTWLWQKN